MESLRSSRQLGSWPTTVAFAVALTLHALLLDLSASRRLVGDAAPRLLLVALRAGGGTGDAPGWTAGAAPPQAASRPPSPPAPLRSYRRHRASPAMQSGAHSVAESPALFAAAALPANDTVAGDGAARAGEGGGTGTGTGTGAGAGSGAEGEGTDQRAACQYCPEPHYPLIARARGWAGTVYVGLSVLADGTVEWASLRRSSGYGVLDEAAVAVARHSRFTPPAARGLPMPLYGRLAYRFELSPAR